MENKIVELENVASNIRKHAINLAYQIGENGVHIGPALSMVEIVTVLYKNVMNFRAEEPTWGLRDRFILSKGHGALAYYIALYEAGIISKKELYTYEKNGGFLPGQPVMNIAKGIEYSSGSLGMGLSFGIGLALAANIKKQSYNVYVLMGDGECNEGSVWESAMSAAHYKLNNLIAIIDFNNMQSDGNSREILDMGEMKSKWASFGWNVKEVDGHDIKSLINVFKKGYEENQPTVVIANTIKGKGISFMEHNPEWHHGQLTTDLYVQAMHELGGDNDEL